jgi:hypothetical protein
MNIEEKRYVVKVYQSPTMRKRRENVVYDG